MIWKFFCLCAEKGTHDETRGTTNKFIRRWGRKQMSLMFHNCRGTETVDDEDSGGGDGDDSGVGDDDDDER